MSIVTHLVAAMVGATVGTAALVIFMASKDE